ncbi:hypothetical protein BAE44_0011982 [Dichanthelium oligosanthes]|uniref:Serine/threonine-protein phosphatase 4 regulatory subunit 3-like central domain-containing protein n=1 Tax=Dichanthelium oligosanthes TaxID=888268 RepID=A0A1E5VPF7_9POAL|nr:hypothetical protein BAE44_0011982 [Dichanthelium oligosanthes]
MSFAGKKPGMFSVAEVEGLRGGADPETDSDSDSDPDSDPDVAAVCAKVKHVKLYCFTDDGQWDNQGTGHVTIDHIEDDGTLLVHKISSDDIYKKEKAQAIPCPTLEVSSSSLSHGLSYDSLVSVNDELKDLPPLELSSLPSILKDEFFPKLVNLFRMCEGSRNMDGLHMIFRLVKGIILLNNFGMFHNIFSDDFILDIIGALEYDPEVCHVHNHRASVQKAVVFKEVLFLHEFCTLSRSLHPIQQSQLSWDLVSEGVFDIISDVLQSQDKVLVSAGTDILLHFLDQDPDLVRAFIAHHEENYQEGNSLLEILVQGMVDSGVEMRYQSCLMTLLGSSAPKTATNCEEVVIQFFLDKHLHKLIDMIASSCPPKGIAGSTSGSVGVETMVEQHSAKPEILLNICELLCFCDEFLNNRVIKLNLLKPIIEAFVENGDRYNMLHSAVLELFDYIRKENLEFLIEYVAENFWDQLVKFERLESIQAFKLKYQQIMKGTETKQSTSGVDMRKKADERGSDKEEEDYFKNSDGEDSATAATRAQKQSIPARHKSDGLADCDDGDDDKNCDPSPRKPIKADEDDEALAIPVRDLSTVPMVRSSSDDGSHTSGKARKKPKLRVRISFANSVASANVTGRHSDLEDKEEVPLSPSTSTESSDGSGDLGDGSPGSQHQQHATETLDPVHETGGDGNDAADKDLSPKMVLDATKSTDSEPN